MVGQKVRFWDLGDKSIEQEPGVWVSVRFDNHRELMHQCSGLQPGLILRYTLPYLHVTSMWPSLDTCEQAWVLSHILVTQHEPTYSFYRQTLPCLFHKHSGVFSRLLEAPLWGGSQCTFAVPRWWVVGLPCEKWRGENLSESIVVRSLVGGSDPGEKWFGVENLVILFFTWDIRKGRSLVLKTCLCTFSSY